jgi:DNA-binding transcriptional LysR family regulator
MMNFDIDCLRTFSLVTETMNFSRAAEKMFRSQSTVSQQISRLEEQVGTQLFIRRKGRILKLTHEGSRLLQYAGQILRLNDEAYSAISDAELAGFVRLGVPLDFFGRDFTNWLAAFKRQHPLLALEVESNQSEFLAKRADQGDFDLAFFKQEASSKRKNVALREQLVWVTGRNIAPPMAGSLPLILFPDGCTYRRLALEGLRRLGRPWHLSFVSPSFECLRTAIDEGLGVTVLARALVTPEMQVIDHAAGLPPLPQVDLVYAHAREEQTREVIELTDFLINRLCNAAVPSSA